MKKIFFGTLILSFISGCTLISGDKNPENVPFSGSDAFIWSDINEEFKDITFLGVDEDDLLIIAKNNGWYSSNNYGKNFVYHSKPDSTEIINLKKIDGVYYAIGSLEVQVPLFGDSISVITASSNALFTSTDGNIWEKFLGSFRMVDFIKDNNNYLQITKYNGVSSIDLDTNIEYLNEFLFTNSSDFIKMIDLDGKGDLFVTSHDGIYKSKNSGRNWFKVTEEIGKHDDESRYIKILDDYTFVAQGTTNLFQSDNGEDWTRSKLYIHRPSGYKGAVNRMSNYSFSFVVTNDKFGIDIESWGVFVSKPGALNELYFAGPEGYSWDNPFPFNTIKTFNNGNVIVYSKGIGFKIGSRNLDSDFWD